MAATTATSEVELARLGPNRFTHSKNTFADEKTASKEAITAAFKAAETATAAALQAQKESADKSEVNANKQLEMHNGLIRKMDSLVGNFPDKDSVTKDFTHAMRGSTPLRGRWLEPLVSRRAQSGSLGLRSY